MLSYRDRMTDSSPDTSASLASAEDEPEEQTDFESRSDSATKLKSEQRDVTLTVKPTSPHTTPVRGPQGGTFQSPFVDMGEVYPNDDVVDSECHPNPTAQRSSSKGEEGLLFSTYHPIPSHLPYYHTVRRILLV